MSDKPEQSDKLLPCPFCGGEAELKDYGDNEQEWGGAWEFWMAGCPKCDVGRCNDKGYKVKAVELWNQRCQPERRLLADLVAAYAREVDPVKDWHDTALTEAEFLEVTKEYRAAKDWLEKNK